MPRIEELESAIVASDDDLLPVSQSGAARRVSRAQLLAGTQAELSLIPGLLGRVSSGLGPPERIGIGGGLTLAGGVLSGSLPFSVNSLQGSASVALTDSVAVSQAGQDRAVLVRTLLGTGGVDISAQTARTAFSGVRALSDWLSDGPTVEAFGAVGDGVTDDLAAFSRAAASGRPILLGAKTYRVDGQWTIQFPTVLIGVPGLTKIVRASQQGGSWINATGSSFAALNIEFDAGGAQTEGWAVLLSPTCVSSLFENCTFTHASGALLGTGLTIQARDGKSGDASSHTIRNCSFIDNDCHGLWVQAAGGARVEGCNASGNGGFGICLDFNDPSFGQVVRQSTIVNCYCSANERGISVGNYNETNLEPPRWGLANPDAVNIIIADNICLSNRAYGIAVSGSQIDIRRNQIVISDLADGASGLLCNTGSSSVCENTVIGPGQYGIDAGGCADTTIIGNRVQDCVVGLNPGGSNRIRVAGNSLINNHRAITVFFVETDSNGSNFGRSCSDVWIEGNLIQLSPGCGGIFLFDGPQRIEIIGNRFISADASSLGDLLWAYTDSLRVCDNSWNGNTSVSIGSQLAGPVSQLVFPEILDSLNVPMSTSTVDRLVGLHQSQVQGQITFLKVVSGGTGYTGASVSITGSGAGAEAMAYVRDGCVIGIAVTSGGAGYDALTTRVIIAGDGVGASATATVGLNIPVGRKLRINCAAAVRFTGGFQQANWTGTDITVPAGSDVVWESVGDGWQANSFANVDYLVPGGDGSVSLRSAVGDVTLRSSAGSGVRVVSDVEQGGFKSCFGRGSPEGVVLAPPGSDYRNLNGGIGTTLWVKQSGTGSLGWIALV